ncbi:MAG: DUF309 domain-containing protein [Phycisphaerales bacterium]
MTPPPAYNTLDPEEERKLFLEGIEVFNEKDFFEAHEVWEEVWAMCVGERARFYQGLIQIAVTLEHINRDNPRGVQKVWRTAQSKFEGLPDLYMGVNIPKLLDSVRPFIEPILAMETARGQQPHDIELKWNPAEVPNLVLEYDPWESGEA